jgi:hypothetical protein
MQKLVSVSLGADVLFGARKLKAFRNTSERCAANLKGGDSMAGAREKSQSAK